MGPHFGQESMDVFEWKGIAKIWSEGRGKPALGPTGVAGSVLRVSKVAAPRRRQLWRIGDGGVG